MGPDHLLVPLVRAAPHVAPSNLQPAHEKRAYGFALGNRLQPLLLALERLPQLVLHLALRVAVERLAAALPVLPAEIRLDAHRAAYGVEPICAVLPIAPATYHGHKARQVDASRLPARAVHDDGLKTEIRRVWTEHHGVYGSRKVWRQLKREGFAVPRCTVERLMRELNLQGAVRVPP